MEKICAVLLLPFLFLGTGCSDNASVSSLSLSSVDGGIGGELTGIDQPAGIGTGIIDAEEDPVAPDPVVISPEPEPDPVQCVSRKVYTIKTLGGSTDVTPYNGPIPAAVNYNYHSWSAHPITGSTPKGYEGQFFLYEDGEGSVAFNFLFSVDAGGSVDSQISMNVTVKNNQGDDQVILSDDRLELKKISTENGESLYQAKMRYWKNTDGGIIGPVVGDNLSIKVKLNSIGDNREINFYSANGSKVKLGSEFEIVSGGSIEECSVDVDKEIQRNTCINKEYIVRKGSIEDAKWFDEHEERISVKKEKIKELRKIQRTELVELRKKLNEEVKSEVVVLRDVKKRITIESLELTEYYESKLVEITEIYKKKREVLVSELNIKIKEIQSQESKKVCTRKKGFFGWLKRLFCKFVRFVGKVVGVIFRNFENSTTKFLERIGLLHTRVNSSTELIEVRNLAVSKMDIEFEEERKILIEEGERKFKELTTQHETEVMEQKAVIVESRFNRTREIKELVARHKTEIREFTRILNKEIKEWRTVAVKHQNAVHKEFTESIQKCL